MMIRFIFMAAVEVSIVYMLRNIIVIHMSVYKHVVFRAGIVRVGTGATSRAAARNSSAVIATDVSSVWHWLQLTSVLILHLL